MRDMVSTTSSAVAAPRTHGRLLLWLGLVLALLAPAAYVVQVFGLKQAPDPWYVPIMGTLGALAALLALVLRPTLWRVLAVLLLGLLAGAEWWFVGVLSRVPAYAGPVEKAQPFPAFQAVRADDGKPFTHDSLKGDRDTVLLFFRGWW